MRSNCTRRPCFRSNGFTMISVTSGHSALSASFGFADAARTAGIIAARAAANARHPIATLAESGSAGLVSNSRLVMM